MITIDLQLKHQDCQHLKPEAWYIAGESVQGWVEQIAQWNCVHTSLRILPMPTSQNDQSVSGILVIANQKLPENFTTWHPAFRSQASQLYLPCEASLSPQVNDAELKDLLISDNIYVWHPGIGLIVFEGEDILQIHDLLVAPYSTAQDWSFADPGIVFPHKIMSLSPEISLEITDLLLPGKEDIGERSTSLKKLPKGPKEPSQGVINNTVNAGKNLTAKMIYWLTTKVPSTSTEHTWINSVENWAINLIETHNNLELSRNREISRLLHLLMSDPDEGLKFALPVSGGAGRGIAPPSDQLSQSNVNYTWEHLNGGQAVDYWDLSRDDQYKLTTRYRDLASREINLGRHRRAAYIYAELLGDYNSAANALMLGEHWREAAILYKVKLNRPLEAANCYQKGSLWTECVALYEELGEYEKAGDIYRILGQTKKAHIAYRKEVGKYREKHDFFAAADLLEKKLEDDEAASRVLASSWPQSSQANLCIRRLFDKYAKQGKHEKVLEWVKRFRANREPLRKRLVVAHLLGELAKRYPDQSVKKIATDCSLSLLSRWIPESDEGEKRRLLNSLGALVPSDRLLRRDCDRFFKNDRAQTKPAEKQIHKKANVELVKTIQLDTSGKFKTAICYNDTIYAISADSYQLNLIRSDWEGDNDRSALIWRLPYSVAESKILLSGYNIVGGTGLLLHALGHDLFTQRIFPVTDAFSQYAIVGPVSGMSTELLAASTSSIGTNLLELRNGYLSLITLGENGKELGSMVLEYPQKWVLQPDFYSLHTRNKTSYLGLENELWIIEKNKVQHKIEMGDLITSISSGENGKDCLVTYAVGSSLFCSDVANGLSSKEISLNIKCPVGCINYGNYVIVSGDSQCQVFSPANMGNTLIAEFSIDDERPIAVLPAPQSDRFGIVTESGKLFIYQI
ncbi:MAG: hypothetical protein MPJ24_06640 [Pirellulaceae bacterium]|nr:hypothetical protein [Pirellulaceae bacterium]